MLSILWEELCVARRPFDTLPSSARSDRGGYINTSHVFSKSSY